MQYWSPTWGGFAFRVMATANERKNDPAGTNAHDYGANVTFNRGPLYLFATWEQHKDNSNGNAFGQVILAPPATAQTAGIAGYKEDGAAVGGSVNVGPVKVGAQYQEFKKGGPSANDRSKQKSQMVNVVWTIGNHQLIGQYMHSKGGKLNTAVTEELDCNSGSVGYQYNFTRRTFFIASYVKVDNNSTATCNFGANTLSITAGQDPQGGFVGIRHVF
jgi:predicted porin